MTEQQFRPRTVTEGMIDAALHTFARSPLGDRQAWRADYLHLWYHMADPILSKRWRCKFCREFMG